MFIDLGCPLDAFAEFIQQHRDRTVVVYANTSARVKALADWVVTGSCALEIVGIGSCREKILWAPDQHLGRYIQAQTGADVVMERCLRCSRRIQNPSVSRYAKVYPDAAVLVHPESPAGVIELADAVGSTSAIIKAAGELPNKEFIVATDRGIFHKLRQLNPDKLFIEAPIGATVRLVARVPIARGWL